MTLTSLSNHDLIQLSNELADEVRTTSEPRALLTAEARFEDVLAELSRREAAGELSALVA